MDIRKIKKLIELLEQSEVDEIEVHEGEESVRIRRSPPVVAAPGAGVSYVAAPPPAVPSRAPAAPAVPEPAPAGAEPEVSGHTVTSPMVGTYFSASSPGSRPFVNVGQRIEVGDTLCIIEAMKILNQVEADCTGVVSAVLVENGQPVEYGQPLFIVDLDA